MGATLVAASCAACATDPGYYLVVPYDNAGERSVDLRYWTTDFPDAQATIWPEIGFGYGVNHRWTTGFRASWIGSGASDLKLSTLNWQNDVMLTQGELPFDLAVHTKIVRFDGVPNGWGLEAGPVLQTEIGKTQLNANLFFESNHRPSKTQRTLLKYQWQASYHWRPWLHAGVQGFGELGPWADWAPRDDQSHRAGPAVSGSLLTVGTQEVRYTMAWLSGSIYRKHGRMFTMRLQYVF